MNKENTNPFMTTSCQIVFSTKFNPCEINDMLFNDDTLKEIFKSGWVPLNGVNHMQ